jgi:hypothetical protein
MVFCTPFWRVVAVAAAVLTLAGCDRDDPLPTFASRPPTQDWAAGIDVVTRSGQFPEQHRVVIRAMDAFIAACMTSSGMSATRWHELNPEQQDISDEEMEKAVDYGISSRGAPQSPSASPPAMTHAELQLLMGKEQVRVQFAGAGGAGISDVASGCLGEARKRLGGGDFHVWATLEHDPEFYNDKAIAKLERDAAYTGALASWSVCMKSRGYRYGAPSAAMGALVEEYDRSGVTPQLQQKERATYAADAACKARVGLKGIALQRRRAMVIALDEKDRHDIARLGGLWDMMFTVAQKA